MSGRTKILLLVLPVILVVGFVYLRYLVKRVFFESAQPGEQEVRTRLSEAALETDATSPRLVTLYFPSPDEDKLIAETRSMSVAKSEVDRMRQILLALVEGPRQGEERALPPSTAVRAVFLTPDGTAYLDFSQDLQSTPHPGIRSETLAAYAIVDSLAANLPEVKRAKILVQGQEVDTLAGHADLTGYWVPNLPQ